MKLAKTTQVLLIALPITIFSTNAVAQKLYKWVDSKGNISYQDQPPPENAKVLEEKTVATTGDVASSTSNSEPIKVYTVDECAVCAQSVLHLTKMGIPYVELPLNGDREAQSAILEKTSRLIAPSIMIGDDILQAPSNSVLTEAVKNAGYAVDE